MAKHRPSIIALMGRAALGVSLFAWLIGTAMPARGSPTASISLDTHILNPPYAITDLSASPVGVQNGDVQLVWTAPANLNSVGMDHYLVRYATYPAPSQAQADAWWSSFAATEKKVSP